MKLLILFTLLATTMPSVLTDTPRVGETKDACYYCKANVGVVQQFVSNTTTQQNILEGAEKICGFLEGDLQKLCNAKVKEAKSDPEEFWTEILALLEPTVACGMVGACKTDGAVGVEEIVGNVLSMIPNVKSRNEVRSKMFKMCSLLPPSQHFYCRSLVKTSESESSNTPGSNEFPIKFSCRECEGFVSSLYQSLRGEEKMITVKFAAETMVCGSMECYNFTEKYFDLFWNIIIAELSHGDVMCPVLGCSHMPTTTTTTTTTTQATTKAKTPAADTTTLSKTTTSQQASAAN